MGALARGGGRMNTRTKNSKDHPRPRRRSDAATPATGRDDKNCHTQQRPAMTAAGSPDAPAAQRRQRPVARQQRPRQGATHRSMRCSSEVSFVDGVSSIRFVAMYIRKDKNSAPMMMRYNMRPPGLAATAVGEFRINKNIPGLSIKKMVQHFDALPPAWLSRLLLTPRCDRLSMVLSP